MRAVSEKMLAKDNVYDAFMDLEMACNKSRVGGNVGCIDNLCRR